MDPPPLPTASGLEPFHAGEVTLAPFYLNPVERIGGLVLSPSRTIRLALDELDWYVPMGFLLAIGLLETTQVIGRLALDGAPDVRQFLRTGPYVLLITSVIQEVVPWLIQSGAFAGLARLVGREQSLYAAMVAIGYARFPRVCIRLATSLALLLGGPFRSAAEYLLAGVGALAVDFKASPEVANLLSNFSPVNLWGFWLVAIAVEQVTGLDRRRAMAWTGLFSVIALLFQAVVPVLLRGGGT